MGQTRMKELLRCPTLEQPSLEYFEVRLPWQSFAVRRETAERVLEAVFGYEPVEWIRLETVGGSVAWVRTQHVTLVREWSSAQRESERQFWKQIDEEYESAKETSAGSEEQEGQPEVEAPVEGAEAEAPTVESSEGGASDQQDDGRGTFLMTLLMLFALLAVATLKAVLID